MKRLLVFLLWALLPAAAGCGAHAPRMPAVELTGDGDDYAFEARGRTAAAYVLSTGDIFDVNFLFEPQLSSRVTVRPDGAVALPIMGDIRVAGMAPAQLDSLLTRSYATYFRDPELTVNVVEFAPPSVYVLGEVRSPNQVRLTTGMSLLQALAMVGGPVPGADLGSVVLIRRVGERGAVAERLDVGKMMAGKGRAWDVLLAPYDIIYVPATFIAQLGRFVDSFFMKMLPVPTLYLRGWEIFHTEDVYDTFLRPTDAK
jgi:polysaccharide export outer membrane protein